MGLLPHAQSTFLTIKDYIMMLVNAGAQPDALQKLKQRQQWCRVLLQNQDWFSKKAKAVQQVQKTLDSLEQLTSDLAHDKLKFKDAAHRTREISRFEKEFNPASRHAAFEESTELFKQLCSISKDIVGLVP